MKGGGESKQASEKERETLKKKQKCPSKKKTKQKTQTKKMEGLGLSEVARTEKAKKEEREKQT